MERVTKAAMAVLVGVGVLLSLESQPRAQAGCPCITEYGARGVVVQTKILNGKVKATLVDAKVGRPGSKEATLAEVESRFDALALGLNLLGGLKGTLAHATANAGGGKSKATAELLNFDLALQGLYNLGITADVLRSEAQAVCTFPDGTTSGASEIFGLAVDLDGLGVKAAAAVDVTGAPNQVIPLPLGAKLVLNEQKKGGGTRPGITVNALHLVVPNIADVVISSSQASLTCFCAPTN